MRLTGVHHVTMITADAPANVAFYAGLLGLRLVKKTVNFDRPSSYHLYYGGEHGSPGSILTWLEFPGAHPGRAGAGDVHMLRLAVGAAPALDFWGERLEAAGVAVTRMDAGLRFADPDGLTLELVALAAGEAPLRARAQGVPAEHAIAGFVGARAYADFHATRDTVLTDLLGFAETAAGEYRLDRAERRFAWGYDPPPGPSAQGAGSVHHIAWAVRDEDLLAWQARLREAGGRVTDVRDREYFKAIYVRIPRGTLFEFATLAPGFAVDEPAGHLGEELRLPHMHAHLRAELEQMLTPILNPREVNSDA